jgi:hypothetical protein
MTAEDNGKVTIALLGVKLDAVASTLDKLNDKFDAHLGQAARRDERIALTERDVDAVCSSYKELRSDVEGLKKRSNILDAVTGALAIIAGLLGITK